MRILRFSLRALALLLAGSAWASGPIVLPHTLTVEGVTYQDTVYVKHDDSRVTFTHASGMASVEIRELPEWIRKELDYDPKKALAAEDAAATARRAATQQQIRDAQTLAMRHAKQAFLEQAEKTARPIVATIVEVMPDGILIDANVQTIGLISRTVNAGDPLFPKATKTIQEPGSVDACLSDNPSGKVFIHTKPGDLVDGGQYRGTVYPMGTLTYRDDAGGKHTIPRFTDSQEEAADYLEQAQRGVVHSTPEAQNP
ncbi:MAG TPA: hypothetical protein VIM48_11260 [Chthoniobacterales bacterium]